MDLEMDSRLRLLGEQLIIQALVNKYFVYIFLLYLNPVPKLFISWKCSAANVFC